MSTSSKTKLQRILVTGSSRGIGRACAERLARDGFHVILHCVRNLAATQEVAENITSLGGECSLLQFDVSDREQCRTLIAAEIEEHGPLFGLVSNAGIISDAQFTALAGEDWDSVIHTNLDSFYNVVQPMVGPLIASRMKGRVVCMSSISGIIGNKGQVNYSAAKAGIIGASKALSQEVARRGITVNCVAPGLIKTDMVADVPLEQVMQHIPMRRLGKPEEVAGVVSFLCSSDASYVTGQVISVNGGMI